MATMASMTSVGPDELCPNFAPFFGYSGAASAMILTAFGAAYGTAKSGIGIAGVATFKPELVMRSLLPVVMAGILAVYGLVIAVVIAGAIQPPYSLLSGSVHMGAGLAVGWAGVAAGYAIGLVGDAGVRGFGQSPRLFVGMLLMLIFSEVLGLYGLIVGLILNTKADDGGCQEVPS